MSKSIKSKFIVLLSAIFVIAFGFAACAEKDYKLSYETIAFSQVGESKLVTASHGNAAVIAEWTSSDEAVASVLNGVIRAESNGTATITATYGDLSKNIEVTVKVDPKINIEGNSVVIKNSGSLEYRLLNLSGENEEQEVSANVNSYSIYDAKDVTWESSDPSVATIDKNGLIKARKDGVTIIKATSKTFSAVKTITKDGDVYTPKYLNAELLVSVGATNANASLFNTYTATLDWVGAAAAHSDKVGMNGKTNIWGSSDAPLGYIKGSVELKLNADGTFRQFAKNLPRNGWTGNIEAPEANATAAELVSKYGAGAYPYNRDLQKAETVDGKNYIALSANAMTMFAEDGIFIVAGGDLYLYYNSATATSNVNKLVKAGLASGNAWLDNDYTPFKNQINISSDFKVKLVSSVG